MQPVLDLAVMDGMVEDGVVALELEVDAPLEVPSVRGERDAEGNPDEARLGEVPRTFDEDVDVLAVALGGHEQMGSRDVEAVGDDVVHWVLGVDGEGLGESTSAAPLAAGGLQLSRPWALSSLFSPLAKKMRS